MQKIVVVLVDYLTSSNIVIAFWRKAKYSDCVVLSWCISWTVALKTLPGKNSVESYDNTDNQKQPLLGNACNYMHMTSTCTWPVQAQINSGEQKITPSDVLSTSYHL